MFVSILNIFYSEFLSFLSQSAKYLQEQHLVSESCSPWMGVLPLKRVNLAFFRYSRERGRAAREPAARSCVHGAGNRHRRGDPRGPAGIRPVETVPRDWHGNDHYKGWTVRHELDIWEGEKKKRDVLRDCCRNIYNK